MASIRQGYLDDYSQQNQNVGIGTSIPKEKLEIHGGVTSKDLNVTGIATLTSASGFIKRNLEYSENVDLDAGDSATLSDEIIVGAGLTMTIGTGVTAGQGNIDSLKVYKMFQPPTGGTNQRPVGKPGSLFYNTDFKTVEFFDGNSWRQVDNVTRRGRAVISSGYGPSPYPQKYDYVNIMNLGNSLDFGRMQNALRDKQGCGSRIRGLFGAGLSPSNSDVIEYLTFASEGDGIDFGDLTSAVGHNAALSSATRGIWAGGYAPGFTNTMEYVEINTLGDAINFGDLTVASGYLAGGISNGVRGIFAGGTNPNAPASVVRTADFFRISSLGNTILFGDLTAKHQRPSGASNSVTGLVFSGRDDMPQITKITMASTGSAENFGQLSEGRYSGFSASNQVRALHGGGSGLSSTNTNTIEFVTISTSGSAEDFGDLSYKNSFVSATSDSHGGLGGY